MHLVETLAGDVCGCRYGGLCLCSHTAAHHALQSPASSQTTCAVHVQVRRLKMYNSGKAKRNKQGKIVSQELQSKELPSTRIVPDRRWFGNTRVIGQKQLTSFREQMADKVDNPFMVLLKERKLPLQVRYAFRLQRERCCAPLQVFAGRTLQATRL
jgi:NGP1NT (NUC091) domain